MLLEKKMHDGIEGAAELATTYDKEQSIAAWRATLASTGNLFEGDLDELESHLRDELDALEEVDLRGRSAFEIAKKRLGEIGVLAAEFAKVNPLLVWRTALFYLASGCFITLVGMPIYELVIHAAMNLGLAVHAPLWLVSKLTFSVALLFPFATFIVLFLLARRRAGKRFRPFESPLIRILSLVGAAFTMLAGRLYSWPLFSWEFHTWGKSVVQAFVQPRERAFWWLSILAPLMMGAFVVHLGWKHRARERATAQSDRANMAPLLWIAVGCFIGIVRSELHFIVRDLSIFAGRVAHLGSQGLIHLSWLSALLCPLLLTVTAWSFLRFRAPSPDKLAKSATFALMIAMTAGLAIYATHTSTRWFEDPYKDLDAGTLDAMFLAMTFADILVALVLPVAVGSLIMRLYPSSLRLEGVETLSKPQRTS